MEISFYKYQGAGNDFILLDNRSRTVALSQEQIAQLCDRHFGIGADGLMLLEPEPDYDFRMVYYNSDGNESSMCGNGGRCITAFARMLGVVKDKARFLAIDGPHTASVNAGGQVSLDMTDVDHITRYGDHLQLNTGSPHYIKWVEDVDRTDVFREGRAIRNQVGFLPKGINVNFVQRHANGISVRTYERGVEDETLSCGTGVTAAAIAYSGSATGRFTVPVTTPGGLLEVSFEKDSADTARNIVLKGPALLVFQGQIRL